MTMRSTPPASSHLAESPVPAPPPTIGSPRAAIARNFFIRASRSNCAMISSPRPRVPAVVRNEAPRWLSRFSGFLPGRELGFDLLEEPRAALGPGVVHVVVGDIVAARARGADQPHRAGHEPARRIAHQNGPDAAAAVGAHNPEAFDVVEPRDIVPVVFQCEAH